MASSFSVKMQALIFFLPLPAGRDAALGYGRTTSGLSVVAVNDSDVVDTGLVRCGV